MDWLEQSPTKTIHLTKSQLNTASNVCTKFAHSGTCQSNHFQSAAIRPRSDHAEISSAWLVIRDVVAMAGVVVLGIAGSHALVFQVAARLRSTERSRVARSLSFACSYAILSPQQPIERFQLITFICDKRSLDPIFRRRRRRRWRRRGRRWRRRRRHARDVIRTLGACEHTMAVLESGTTVQVDCSHFMGPIWVCFAQNTTAGHLTGIDVDSAGMEFSGMFIWLPLVHAFFGYCGYWARLAEAFTVKSLTTWRLFILVDFMPWWVDLRVCWLVPTAIVS